jgi:acetyl-CoA carboxylase carboxyl transferase subunit beta
MEHGMVDMVVSRLELRETIARLLKILLKTPMPRDVDEPEILPPPALAAPETRPRA